MSDQRTVIVGAGQAGGTAAAALRQLGYAGSITIVGDERWPPYERPPLSKALLQGKLEIEKTFLRPAAFYAEQGIRLITGRQVQAIDRAERLLRLDEGKALTRLPGNQGLAARTSLRMPITCMMGKMPVLR